MSITRLFDLAYDSLKRYPKEDIIVEKGILNQIAEFDWIAIERPKWEDQLDLPSPLALEISKISASQREIKKL